MLTSSYVAGHSITGMNGYIDPHCGTYQHAVLLDPGGLFAFSEGQWQLPVTPPATCRGAGRIMGGEGYTQYVCKCQQGDVWQLLETMHGGRLHTRSGLQVVELVT